MHKNMNLSVFNIKFQQKLLNLPYIPGESEKTWGVCRTVVSH